jgi:3-hydroxyisobutyrate dehydrogenase-like beta-hydroxyacid dehydrogenase
VAKGATAASSPAAAAEGADFVHIVVFDDQQAKSVVTDSDGVLATLEAGTIVCLHTTIRLDTIHELAAQAAPRGVTILDAGISGFETGAANGTLLTMVGGPAEAVDRVRPILDVFSKEVIHAGPLGAGMSLKLARNSAGYLMMAAVHEAMLLAHASGVELALLQHVITNTGVFDQAIAPFIFGEPTPLPDDAPESMRTLLEHTNRLAEKDLSQALALAATVSAEVPVIELLRNDFGRVLRVPD